MAQQLESYVPRLVARRFAGESVVSVKAPEFQKLFGAVLFADISGALSSSSSSPTPLLLCRCSLPLPPQVYQLYISIIIPE